MLARVMNVSLKPERIDEAVANWPTYTGKFKGKGLHAGYMLLDRKSGRVLSVTLWRDEAALKANEASAEFKGAIDIFRPYFAAEPSSAYYAVAASVE
ncbi:MAG: antibiotic biosynthesis monooxygenase family protein [Alphaproteobacteria bacterium]